MDDELEREIAVLMSMEIAEYLCGSVNDGEKYKCRAVLYRVLAHGKGFESLSELSVETRRAIREKLKEMGVG